MQPDQIHDQDQALRPGDAVHFAEDSGYQAEILQVVCAKMKAGQGERVRRQPIQGQRPAHPNADAVAKPLARGVARCRLDHWAGQVQAEYGLVPKVTS